MRTARKLGSALLGGGVAAPAAPTVSAAPTSASNLRVSVSSIGATATTLKIYRSTDNVSFSLIDTVAVTGTSQNYDDATGTAGTNYWYKVGANNAGGEGLSTSSKANTLTYQLISYWKLDETSAGAGAVTRNDSFGTNHLTDTNTVPSVSAILGNGAQFTSGNSERLSVASNSTLETGDIDFMIGGWFYISATPDAGLLSKASVDSVNGYEFALYFYNTDQKVGFAVGSNANVQSVKWTNALSQNTWYYILGWQVSGGSPTINISVNGSAAVSAARTVTPVANSAKSFQIGSVVSTRYLTGRADEVGFWKRIPASSELTALYNGGSGKNDFLP